MNAAERRSALIDATVRLITREGLASTSTRAIAAEADMPLSSLHYVFESRDQLVSLAVRDISIDLGLRVDVGDIDFTSLATAIRSTLSQILDVVNDDLRPTLAVHECLAYAARSESLSNLGRMRWSEDVRMVRYFLELIATRVRLRWTVPIEQVAAMTLTMVEGITFAWLNTRDNATAWLGVDGLVSMLTQLGEPLAEGEVPDAGFGTQADFAELFGARPEFERDGAGLDVESQE